MKIGKQSAAPDELVSDEALMAAIRAKLRTLDDEDRALCAQQVEMEKAGHSPVEPSAAPDPRAMAMRMLNGFAPPDDHSSHSGASLFEVILRRQAIKIALDVGNKQWFQHAVKQTARVIEESGQDWRELVHATAAALVALRRANAARALFREKLQRRCKDGVDLRHDRYRPDVFDVNFGGDGDAVAEWLDQLVTDGIITARELNDA